MPSSNDLTGPIVLGALALVDVHVTPICFDKWTEIERLIAYDWAMREHLHASDNVIRRRPKPWFVVQSEVHDRKGLASFDGVEGFS